MAETKDPIVYRYKPVHPEDGFPDVPRRDLRQSDVDALYGAALLNVTQPAGEPTYVLVEHKSEPASDPVAKKADDKKGGD